MYGRGGAGNIAQAAATSKKAAEDVEAANPPSTTPSAPSQTSSTASQDYAHMGRGGAGNWFQPKTLQTEGTFSQPAGESTAPPTNATPNVSKPWTPEGQELPVARQGRGGAGNMVWKSEEMWRKEKEDEKRRKEEIEKNAEAAAGGLQSPTRAVFGTQKGGRGW
ncbi:hypothetical protein C7974DRAFT_166118 [Boeremia exigua]|uniref:uncharacterized protein n=1 Tax=Boeremia exigua TaxID=749465 RepID=UPI001E8D7FE9|nr:uncharacterized protein C7974DRAFT_166118 [Boeremia exigua]KAH6633154.1 hypothetical protein C7974DRAFT_166118 [Boeremia exigua]